MSTIICKSLRLCGAVGDAKPSRIVSKGTWWATAQADLVVAVVDWTVRTHEDALVGGVVSEIGRKTSFFTRSCGILRKVHPRTRLNASIVRQVGVERRRTVHNAGARDVVAVKRNGDRSISGIGRVGTPSDAVERAIIGEVGRRAKLHANSSGIQKPVLFRCVRARRFAKPINRISKSSQRTVPNTEMFHLVCKVGVRAELSACIVGRVCPERCRTARVFRGSISVHADVDGIQFIGDDWCGGALEDTGSH